MDIFTQGLLGGVLAQTVAKKGNARTATITGFLSGLLADADVLISSVSDPLLVLEYHRHFTHSLIFIPFGALIAALLLWPVFKRQTNFKVIYLYALMGYSMSGMLDAFTSYGTNLFWPFSDQRVSLSIISVFDPLVTLVLLVSLITFLKTECVRYVYAGLAVCSLYLVAGFAQQQKAEELVLELAISRGHSIERQVIKPTLANLVLWRSVYIYNDRVYVDAVRPGIFSENIIYQGDNLELINPAEIKSIKKDSILFKDLTRFNYFSDGYIVFTKEKDNAVGDIRYSMLANSIKPLWGIEYNPLMQDKHVSFVFYRENTQAIRDNFMTMLLGKEF